MANRRPAAATLFHELHREGLLVLANVWDAGSARVVESAGARALATSSAAVAWSHGWPDGDALPVARLVSTVAEIADVVHVPLSVDMEGGYADDPATVGQNVGAVVDAGGVGCNLEDGTGDPDLLCRKIEAAKAAGTRRGVEVFVNARADVYLRGLVPAERRVDETLARAARYRAAGADGLFVPGVTDATDIAAIAASALLPVNVLARPGLPPAAELRILGVRRLSAGAWLAEALYGRLGVLVKGFLEAGESEPLAEGAMPYADVNTLLAVRPT